ncbi:MAG: hypothetical protein V7K62_30325 [Nostoc sp.]
MKPLLISPNNLITGCSQDHISTEITRFLRGKYSCLCCSNTLLRHLSSEGAYWRCRYCHQEMPV